MLSLKYGKDRLSLETKTAEPQSGKVKTKTRKTRFN